jgi:hypothetical protein
VSTIQPPFAVTLYKHVKQSNVGQVLNDVVLEYHLALPFAPFAGLLLQSSTNNGDELLYEELLQVRYDVPTGVFEADTQPDTALAVGIGKPVVDRSVYREHIADLCETGWVVSADDMKHL